MILAEKFSYFFNPFVIGAVLITAINDHYLKSAFPGFLTGKISDFSGLFFAPFFICVVLQIVYGVWRKVLGRSSEVGSPVLSFGLLFFSIVLVDFVFVAIKTSERARMIYESTLGSLGFPSRVTMDPGDLWALISSALVLYFARAYLAKTSPAVVRELGHSRKILQTNSSLSKQL